MIRSKQASIIVHLIMLCSILAGSFAPMVQLGINSVYAQETTEEPSEVPQETETVEPTVEETTDTPVLTDPPPMATEPTPEPVETEAAAQPEITEEPVMESTEAVQPETTQPAQSTDVAENTEEPAPESTETVTEQPPVTAVPTVDPASTSFNDPFEDGNTDEWILSPGWALTASEDSMFLRGIVPDSSAAINGIDWPHLNLSARARVQHDNTLEIFVRQDDGGSYRVTLDSAGLATLYKGDEMLAAGASIEPGIEQAVWRTITVQALGTYLIVALDGTVQFTYEDQSPLTGGGVAFGTGAENTGAVDIDDVVVLKLEAPAITVTAPAPDPELTETVVPEVTEEPEATPEVEATEEPTSPELVAVPVISADFESELAGWMTSEGAVTVAVSEGNHALLLNSGQNLLPSSVVELTDFRLDSSVNFLNNTSGGLNLVFNSYVLAFEGTQTALYRSSEAGLELLESVPAAHNLNTWHNLRLEVVGGQIAFYANDQLELDYAADAPLTAGALALAAVGEASFFVDNVILYDLVPADELVAPTPLPTYTLTEETGAKLNDELYQVLKLYEAGEQAAAFELAATTNINILDDALNIDVVVWPAQELESLMPVVELHTGLVTAINERNLDVRISLPNLIGLVSAAEVIAVRLPEVTASASTDQAPAQQSGTNLPHSLAIIGWNDWNTAAITGAGVRVAVIDHAGTHRNAVVELVRAIAPNAIVTTFGDASVSVSELAAHIQSARSGSNRIILITMDLGVNASPGDGTGSNLNGTDLVYQRIQEARGEGRLVIVSAGNNTTRQVSFTHTTGTTITMSAPAGAYVVNVSWNGWSDTSNVSSSLAVSGGGNFNSPARIPTGPPSYQFSGNCASACTLTLTFSGNSGRFVQVQLNSPGSITGTTGSTMNTSAGNIGRPADSPYALAVGSVCSAQSFGSEYYPPMYDSSHGPIMAAGGTGPASAGAAITRSDFKPDLSAPSHVNGSVYGAPTWDCALDQVPTGGFNGTSSAAAHVAGMAALLLSNSQMASEISSAANPADALQDYLQTHTIDLFAEASDGFDAAFGFDNVYGAGLTTLGSPSYDLSIVTNLETGGNAIYVGQGNPGSELNGEPNNPYLHLSQAIEAASQPDRPDRIVLMPGEYPSGVGIINRAGLSIEGYNSLATIWVNDSYNGRAGIQIQNSTGITIESIQFRAANPILFDGVAFPFRRPLAIQFFNDPTAISAVDSSVRNSTFSGFIGSEPITIWRTFDVSILNNVFENLNSSVGQVNRAAMQIVDAASATEPIVVRGNIFRNITGTVQSTTVTREAIITLSNSAVDFTSNFFLDTRADATFTINNSVNDDTNMVNMFSNLFVNNEGIVAFLNPAPRLRFINNTVVGQEPVDLDQGMQLLRRVGAVDYRWAVHNNLFYNNGNDATNFRIIEHPGLFSLCQALDNPTNETGARNNWVINTQDNFGNATCDVSFEVGGVAQNNNILSDALIDPISIFIGQDPLFLLNPLTDPLYYQMRGDATGIDRGDPTVLIAPLIDFAENTRSYDGDGDTIDEPDLGAYELVPLSAGPIEVVREEDIFDQSNDRSTAFAIDLRQGVDGGFAPYTFKIRSLPANYSTDPSDFCLGTGVRIQGNYAYYCPPEHFYTSETLAAVPDNIQFEYYAFDRLSDQNDLLNAEFSTVTVEIEPITDLRLTTPINYQFIAEAGTAFQFRLRPSVRFNNYRYSESGTTRDRQADYPYTYNTDITIVNFDNPAMFEDGGLGLEAYIENRIANPNPDGTITLQSRNGERGFVEFTYQVTDSFAGVGGPGTITNTVRLELVGMLPNNGLHDDSSFSFRYNTLQLGINDAWRPVASPGNINNTLHTTSQLNDVATFGFVGEAFVVYMQAQKSGALWELRVDDREGTKPPLQWVRQLDGSWRAETDGFNCVTRAAISGNLISNNGANLYTVSCDGLRGDEAHSVDIINRQSKRNLAVDAFAILYDGDPLLPGVHDVVEHDIFTMFAGWNILPDRFASSGMALSTSSDELSDVNFEFTGTGIAIGTTLEGVRSGSVYLGANYDICITPQIEGVSGQEVCQNFNNGAGATSRPTWSIFRSFHGYNYNPLDANPDAHRVRIHINDIPTGARLVIDSITVFGDSTTGPLSLANRVTEDDVVGAFVFGNGRTGTWSHTTLDRKASNSSLTSLARGVPAVGPFVGFQIPDAADLIHWYRLKGSRDSQNIMVCVDRAQGEAATTDHCRTYNLRTAPNPLIIRELDFGGWGTAWGDNNAHSVEIFSLNNEAFNFDKVEIFSNAAPLAAGMYQDYVLAANNGVFGFFDDLVGNPINGGSFTIVQDKTTARASAASIVRTSTINEGVLFQMTGTGFTAYFTRDRFAGQVQICWLPGILTTTVATVEASGNCRTYVNFFNSKTPIYQVGYSVFGLPAGSHTVTIRNLQNAPSLTGQMQLDAISIANDTLPANLVTDAQARYETSFVNRVTDDMFLYYGNWGSIAGKKAVRYSGQNFDFIQGVSGAGVVFRTDNIDTLRIVRTLRKGYANIEVCIDGTTNCTAILGDRDPAVVHLPDTNEHVVAIVLTSAGRFELDAIDVFNTTTPLQPGMYEDDNPLLRYDATWNNKPSSSYTNRRAQRTLTQQGTLLFHMNGSMLELGAFVKGYNQAQVCFAAGIVTDPGSAAFDANCQNFPANLGQSLSARQVFNSGTLFNNAAIYSVRVRNTLALELVLDYLHVIDGINPLIAGRYENNHPILDTTGTWTTLASKTASNGNYLRTQTVDNFVQFEFEGTGFGIGTFADRYGSEMLVCYLPSSATFDGTWDGTGENCVTFQNEALKASTSITRSITGLPEDTYTVGAVNLNNGTSEVTGLPRDIVTYPPTLVIDFVEVYEGLPAVLQAGTFGQGAVDGSAVPFMQLMPADRWNTVTDKSAAGATDGSYASVVDTIKRVTTLYAGQSATFRVQLPANSTSTLVIDLLRAEAKNASQLQYCVINEGDLSIVCDILTTPLTQRYQVITLENTSGSVSNRTVSFRSLSPGYFRIDNFQFIPNNVLSAGIYEDVLFGLSAIFDTGASTGWTSLPNKAASNGTLRQTNVTNDFVQFEFTGTGFAIGTHTGLAGSEMDVCYQTSALFDGTMDGTGEECLTFQNEIAKGSTLVSRSIVGLPADTYIAGVINRDDGLTQRTVPPAPRDIVRYPATLIIDYVEIFTASSVLLGPDDGGDYNQDAADGSNPLMLLLPAKRWATIAGKPALGATNGNFASIVDNIGRASGAFAGPTAAFQVEIAADSLATITLRIFGAGKGHSDQLQYCVLNGVDLVECNVLNTMLTNPFQVITINNPTGSAVTRTVFLQTLTPSLFRIDGFQLMQGRTLNAGVYEDLYIGPDALIDANGAGWSTIAHKSYSNGSIRQASVANADFAQFEFLGTGFGIGTHIGRNGSEMEVCYQTSALFDGSFIDGDDECIVFQNESAGANLDILRTITGLPEDTYTVGVLHRDDGFSNLSATPTPRSVTYPARMVIDTIQIFNTPATALIDESGTFNENAEDSGVPLIQLLPANRWGKVTGKAAAAASGGTYTGVLDGRGRITSASAAGSATLRLAVPANSSITLAIDTVGAGKGSSGQLMYCVLNGAQLVDNCQTITTMPVSIQQVVTIENNTGVLANYTVFFQLLTPGYFRIDDFQVIVGDTLTEGIYDNHFMSVNGLINVSSNWQLPPTPGTKVKGSFGGDVIRTQTQNAEMTFTFEGSGFSIITVESIYRLGIEVCYVTETQFQIDGFTSAVCRLNAPEVGKGTFVQYGLSFYGLTPDTYVARVRVTQAVTDVKRQWFQVDALVIFGDVTSAGALQPGVYDDAALLTNPSVRFAPQVFWSMNPKIKSGPPRGPWKLTERQATNSGAVLQVFVEGNTLILYQEVGTKNTSSVQACLVVFGTQVNELLCNTFSQNGRSGFFTPIAFFGLGEGTHEIIFENKTPGRRFNIDGLRVTQ